LARDLLLSHYRSRLPFIESATICKRRILRRFKIWDSLAERGGALALEFQIHQY